MPDVALALDLGGTLVRAGLVTRAGEIVAHLQTPTFAQSGPDTVVGQMAELAARVREGFGGKVAGVGVSAPGPLDTRAGVTYMVQSLAGFNDYPLRDELSKRLGTPVVLENDGIAGAIGEWRHGVGQGANDLLYMTVSTGIGGGIIANGKPLRGSHGLAGHIGHMFFHENWQRYPGAKMTCFEDYASATALAFRARTIAAQHPDSVLAGASAIDSRGVFAAAAAGDAFATQLVEDEVHSLGLGLTSLIHILNPELIVIGGGMSEAFDVLHPGLVRTFSRYAKRGFADVSIVKAGLGVHSCLVGAASLAFESLAA